MGHRPLRPPVFSIDIHGDQGTPPNLGPCLSFSTSRGRRFLPSFSQACYGLVVGQGMHPSCPPPPFREYTARAAPSLSPSTRDGRPQDQMICQPSSLPTPGKALFTLCSFFPPPHPHFPWVVAFSRAVTQVEALLRSVKVDQPLDVLAVPPQFWLVRPK